ncbi:Pancreatic triacylglycerol lipase [Orchesella cincta]|uniref:Pancreatic triacylglycerol lipase n=1 Tax=Orchesella cincta TaxID=48709 RepID=A0A1D2NFG9_ORCCI|nr:Pancreatic triacylglycerol lipase [Orchesella cincta]
MRKLLRIVFETIAVVLIVLINYCDLTVGDWRDPYYGPFQPPTKKTTTTPKPRPQPIQRRISQRDAVKFFLYPNPGNLNYKEEIVVGNNVSLSSYNPNYYPILLIHGYMQNFTNRYPQRTKDAYLRMGFKSNIILVDWAGYSQPDLGRIANMAVGYPRAVKHVPRIGKRVSTLLMFLITERVLKDPTSIHMVGFSLGAEIAGVAGYHVKRSTGQLVGRITALEPGGISYHHTNPRDRLDKSDANFVDVMHTAARSFRANSIGHVDFYPNGGGPTQPGCTMLDMVQDIPGMQGSCAHGRAWEYFTDSVYNKKLYACQSTSYMMYKMKNYCTKPVAFGQAKGDYFLDVVHKDSHQATR